MMDYLHFVKKVNLELDYLYENYISKSEIKLFIILIILYFEEKSIYFLTHERTFLSVILNS